MDLNPIVLSIPIFFILMGIELIVERLTHKNLYTLPDSIANMSCGITSQLSGLFLTILGITAYQIIFETLGIFLLARNWIYWSVLFLLVDLAYYWAHRMSHEVNLFWGGHVVHHQSEEYNLSVALRQSSLQVIWTFAFYLPIAMLGFRTEDFVLISALNTLYQFWIHTEIIGTLGWLEYVFNTPSHHRVHHGRNPKYIDKNHAGSLIIWDKLFGTFQPEEERPIYGITKPLNSWNAAWANLSHYADMAKDFKRIPSWGNRLKFVFKKPGWLPASMGGYSSAPEIDNAQYKKYKTPSSTLLNAYVLFQYILCLIGTSLFLFNAGNFSLPEKIGIAFLISFTVVNCGVLFEKRRWVMWAEPIRVIAYSIILGVVSLKYGTNYLTLSLAIAYLIISLGWFLRITRNETITP